MRLPDGGRQSTGRQTKLERVIQKYDLEGFGQELVDRWLGREGFERQSLRSLATVTNRRILATALQSAGETPLDGEVENLVRLLTSNDVSAGMQSQTRQRLVQRGVDVDELSADFVSHQAIHTYLTSVQEAEYEASSEGTDKLADRTETIQRLESRLQAVTESTIDKLRSAGELSIGTFDVIVSVQVLCTDCGEQYGVRDLLHRGGCAC